MPRRELYNPDLDRRRGDIAHAAARLALPRLILTEKYDPDQPRAPAGTSEGGRWVGSGGSSADALARLLKRPPRNPATAGLAAVLALYNHLTRRNGRDRQAIIEFRASEFVVRDGDLDRASVRSLSREEVEQACPRLGETQRRTDAIAEYVRETRPSLGQPLFGTEVHTRLARQIRELGDPNFVSERSFLKGGWESYGVAGTIRIDVLERAPYGVTCVYDIKPAQPA